MASRFPDPRGPPQGQTPFMNPQVAGGAPPPTRVPGSRYVVSPAVAGQGPAYPPSGPPSAVPFGAPQPFAGPPSSPLGAPQPLSQTPFGQPSAGYSPSPLMGFQPPPASSLNPLGTAPPSSPLGANTVSPFFSGPPPSSPFGSGPAASPFPSSSSSSSSSSSAPPRVVKPPPTIEQIQTQMQASTISAPPSGFPAPSGAPAGAGGFPAFGAPFSASSSSSSAPPPSISGPRVAPPPSLSEVRSGSAAPGQPTTFAPPPTMYAGQPAPASNPLSFHFGNAPGAGGQPPVTGAPGMGGALPPAAPVSSPTVYTSYPRPTHAHPVSDRHPRYQTRQMGSPPPSSAVPFVTIDEGNCGPRYIRSSFYRIPKERSQIQQIGLPLGMLIQPLADPQPNESIVPVTQAPLGGPVRCGRCSGYLNAFDEFIDGGRKYKCFLCSHTNDVPDYYFSPLQLGNQRADLTQRPELCLGSVEYAVGDKFIFRPPQPLALIFAIDVSVQAIRMGLVKLVCKSLKVTIEHLSADFPIHFGIATFDHSVHLYDLYEKRQTAQMLVVSDLEEPFIPSGQVDGRLVVPLTTHSRQLALDLLDKIPQMFEAQTSVSSCFGGAIQLLDKILEHRGGKIVCFQTHMPTIGVGALKPRTNSAPAAASSSSAAGQKEFNMDLLKPQSNFYEKLSQDLCNHKIGFNLFVVTGAYVDLATLSELTTRTGGHLHYYINSDLSRDAVKLHNEIHSHFHRTTGYDAIMRVRTSSGLSVSNYTGSFDRKMHDLEVGQVDSFTNFSVELEYESASIDDRPSQGIQMALLYTTTRGERRLRIHTFAIGISTVIPDVFRSIDVETVVALIARQSYHDLTSKKLNQIQANVLNLCVKPLVTYRKNATSSDSTKLLLPDSLKVLPLYLLSLMKFRTLRSREVFEDMIYYKSLVTHSFSALETVQFIYPRMFALHTLPHEAGKPHPEDSAIILPPWNGLSIEFIPQGVFLFDDGVQLLLIVGSEASPEVLNQLFGSDLASFDLSRWLSAPPSELASSVVSIIRSIQFTGPLYKRLRILHQRESTDSFIIASLMTEDKQNFLNHDYKSFLSLLHRQITEKIGKA